MADARQILRPKFTYSLLNDGVMLRRENDLAMRFYFNSASRPSATDAQHLPDIGTLKRSVMRFSQETEALEKSVSQL